MLILGQNDIFCSHNVVNFSVWFLQLAVFKYLVASHVTEQGSFLTQPCAVIKFSRFITHPGTCMLWIQIKFMLQYALTNHPERLGLESGRRWICAVGNIKPIKKINDDPTRNFNQMSRNNNAIICFGIIIFMNSQLEFSSVHFIYYSDKYDTYHNIQYTSYHTQHTQPDGLICHY